jgi:hypothetical protein
MVRIVQIPKNMNLKEKAASLEFEYSWFKIKYPFALVLIPLFSYFLIKSDFIAGDFDHLTIPVILLTFISVALIYYVLAKNINTTKILVTNHEVYVSHGPLPIFKNTLLRKEDIKQLYVTQHRIAHRYNLYAATYQINVILSNDEVITLVRSIESPELGRFIENKIEDFLNITYIDVEGELSKD